MVGKSSLIDSSRCQKYTHSWRATTSERRQRPLLFASCYLWTTRPCVLLHGKLNHQSNAAEWTNERFEIDKPGPGTVAPWVARVEGTAISLAISERRGWKLKCVHHLVGIWAMKGRETDEEEDTRKVECVARGWYLQSFRHRSGAAARWFDSRHFPSSCIRGEPALSRQSTTDSCFTRSKLQLSCAARMTKGMRVRPKNWEEARLKGS